MFGLFTLPNILTEADEFEVFNFLNPENPEEYDKNIKNEYQIDGNFYFASIKFLKKNKSFFRNNMTLPIFQKNKKLYLDIDTKSDYLLAKSFLNK